MTTLERVERLERVMLLFASLITGELHRVSTPEELAQAQQQLGEDFTAMKDGL